MTLQPPLHPPDSDSESDRDVGNPDDATPDPAQPASLSPSEGSKVYLGLLHRMITALGIAIRPREPDETDLVHKILQSKLPPPTVLPMLSVYLKTLKEAWENPAATMGMSKHYEAMYWLNPQMLAQSRI